MTETERQEIIASHAACGTAPNGTGARCTCSYDCANYNLRARGYKPPREQAADDMRKMWNAAFGHDP